MEPILELADRITSHLWIFHECCPGTDRLEQFLSSRPKLEALAANDYSTLQSVLDLADYSEPGYADPGDPLPQFRLETEKGTEESFYYPLPRQRRNRELLIERQEHESDLRKIASREALNVLTARLELLQKLGMQLLFERIVVLGEEEAPSSPETKKETLSSPERKAGELDKPTVWTSDALFEWVARWLSREGFQSQGREKLAEAFLVLLRRGKYGDERYNPKIDSRLKEVPTRFLLEANLDGRARAILKRFSPHGWLNRLRVRWLRFRKRRLLRELSPGEGFSSITAAQLRDHNAKWRLQKTARDEKLRRAAEQWLKRSAASRLRVLLNRSRLRTFCELLEAPVPFSLAFSDELDEICASRIKRLYANPNENCGPVNNEDRGLLNPLTEEKPLDSFGANGTSIRGIKDAAASAASERSGLSTKQAFKSHLLGVALSGGGIRSATFALGVLQGMADRNILPYIDVISSVSGGGYICSWLIAWTKRRGNIHAVQNSLRGFASPIQCRNAASEPGAGGPSFQSLGRNQDPRGDHLRPVRLLREYSRYLAPEEGFLSADSWTIASTWIRNTLLNLTILMLLFGGVLLLPRMVIFLLFHTQAWFHPGLFDGSGSPLTSFKIFLLTFLAGLPFLWICWVIKSRNLRVFGAPMQGRNAVARGFDDGEVLGQIVVPLLLGGLLEVAAIWNFAIAGSPKSTAAGFVTVAVLGIAILNAYATNTETQVVSIESRLVRLLILVGSGLINFGMVYEFCSVLDKFGMNTQRGLWMAGTFGPPLLMVVVGTTIVGLLGLSGTLLSDEQREWWSRLAAWLTMATLGWIAICLICFYMPLWIAMAGIKIAAAGIAWGAVTAAGVKFAFSAKSGDPSSDAVQPRWKTWLLRAAPIVFLVGLLSFTSMLVFWGMNLFIDQMLNPPEWLKFLRHLRLVSWIGSLLPPLVDDRAAHQLCCTNLPVTLDRVVAYYWPLMHGESIASLLLAVCLLGICFIFAWRVDINEFSMHHFYRNRLVRAYLGASRERPHRLPNAFTGFDVEDDIRLQRFLLDDPTQVRDMVTGCKASYIGPFPIVNTTLNVTKGQDLGIQQRRAESFFFSPIWAGFDYSRKQTRVKTSALSEFGFRRTREFGTGATGASLGTAMAISGAAFNSNAGFHTSAPLAFLLTVFGVRLGWWAGNPRWDRWAENSPLLGLGYLLNELTANTTTEKNFVLLTDGGHFENMGLYELVRRRCRYIVVSDAEEDEQFKLEGIGGAVRKCRNDFGVVITLDLEALEPLGKPAKSRMHYSIGTIRYPGEPECGMLVYIKSSLTNDESVDLIEFGKRHQEFPHTSTINQFFDESHFESYRELGHHVASGIFQHDMPKTPLAPDVDSCKFVGDMFEALEKDFKEALDKAKKKDAAISVKLTNEADNDK